MKYEIRDTAGTNLPQDDTHPYRTGVWRPQVREYDAWDMDVDGKIPDDLSGVYLRNTETALLQPIRRYHPFDGDGMLHAMSFGDGEAHYSNRFVRTDGFLAEQNAKQSLYAGITEHPSIALAERGWGVERRQGTHKGFETLDMNVMEAKAHRWRFNLVTGKTTEEQLSERCAEFPMINGRVAGRKYRYAYECRCAPNIFAFDGLIKHDIDSGTETLIDFPDGVFISETVMAPRDKASAEDDGYLLTFTIDVRNDLSECLIFDATSPGDGPIARIRLPERICSGTHATWAPAADI